MAFNLEIFNQPEWNLFSGSVLFAQDRDVTFQKDFHQFGMRPPLYLIASVTKVFTGYRIRTRTEIKKQ